MDSCIILAAFLKRDVIRETFENMTPFLNINEEDGIYYYRILIILKMLFTAFMMQQAVSNRVAQLIFAVGNACIARKYSEIALLPAIAQCSLIFAPNKRFALFLSVSWMCILAMNIKSYEFILDLCAIYSLLCYSWKAYEYEYQKLCTVIYMMLSLGWYVSRLDVYSIDRFFSVIGLLFLAYIPLRPNWDNKHRNRLNYIYALMFLWVVFQFQLFLQPRDQFQTANTTRICRRWGTCALTDNLTSAVGDQITSAKALYEFNNIEIPNITEPTNLEESVGENVTSSEMKDMHITGGFFGEKHIENDSMSLQKNTQTVNNILSEEAEINEGYGNQNMRSDEDKQLNSVEESDSMKNTLQTEDTASSEHPLKTSTESEEESLAENLKYENQVEYLIADEETLVDTGIDDFEKKAVLDENVVGPDQNSEKSGKDTTTKEFLRDVANNKEKISMESVEDSLAENFKYEDQIEGYLVTDEEIFVEAGVDDLKKEAVLDKNVVEQKQNFEKSRKDFTIKEFLADVSDNEKISQDGELSDAISDSAEQNSLTNSDGKCTQKREVSTDVSDSNSMFQSVVLVKETKPQQMTEENFESLTTAVKLNSAEIDEKIYPDEMIKEDFTKNDLIKSNEKKIIKSVMDSEIQLKVANTKDEIFTADQNTEEASELSEGEILELRKVMIERNEVEEEITSVITETDEFKTGFAEKDKGSEVKDVLKKKPIEYLKESEKTVLREVQKSVENQQNKEDDSSRNKKDTSNTILDRIDEPEKPRDSKIRVTDKRMENVKDALQTDEVNRKEAKEKYVANSIKKGIEIASNSIQGRSKSAKIVKEKKNSVQRDATNLRRESESTDVFGYKSIQEETKYPDTMFDDFDSERISEWEASFKSHLMQEEFASDDDVPLKSSTKQQIVEDQPIIQNLFESFEYDTNNERLNRLDMVEYLREKDPYDVTLMDDYAYLVNENENSYEDEDMDDDVRDQAFEVTESDDSTANEGDRNDRMYVVQKRNGKYYIM